MSQRSLLILSSTCLLAGIVLNVGVAWACVAWGTLRVVNGQHVRPATARPDVPESGWLAPTRLDWPFAVPVDWPLPSVRSWSEGFGLRWDGGATDWDAPALVATRLRAGWPMRSVQWAQLDEFDANGLARTTTGANLLLPVSRGELSNWGFANGWVPRRLPVEPAWPGFAVNSVLFAVLLAGVVTGPFVGVRAVRAARRRRRGLCVACGYPVGGAVCSECGRPTHGGDPWPSES